MLGGRGQRLVGRSALLLFEPDGSVLMHQRVGREPVNWQPPGTRISYQTETDSDTPFFVIYSYRFKPPEKMYVQFKTIEIKRSLPTPSAVLQPKP